MIVIESKRKNEVKLAQSLKKKFPELFSEVETEKNAETGAEKNSQKEAEKEAKKILSKVIILDVTSKSEGKWRRMSPFWPHCGIPVPFSEEVKAASVEGLWQGLKVFEKAGVDRMTMRDTSMRDLKRTERRFGACRGHQKGLFTEELLSYEEARNLIYIPSYKWVLDHKLQDLVAELKALAEDKVVVLLDYNLSEKVDDLSKPLSHAYLIKAYCEGLYPFDK